MARRLARATLMDKARTMALNTHALRARSSIRQSGVKIALAAMMIGLMGSGCSSLGRDKKVELAYVERPAETIYNEAFQKLERNQWREAVAFFDEVERQHPYSEWARRAMLMSAYANYRSADHEASVAAAERFVGLHPGNSSAPYAYYLIAINYYDQIFDVGRDQGTTVLAENALQQVVRRYPDSEYAQDARLKLELTQDHLAGKEMTVGRWYLRQGHTLAAILRFKTVVAQYDTTSHTEEALHRLVESYVSLGMIGEATQVGSVLGYNYPDSEWYRDSYNLLIEFDVDLDGEIEKQQDPSYWRRLRDNLL